MWGMATPRSYRSYDMMDAEERPPTVRAAIYLGPGGMVLLMLAAFLASATWVCSEECVRDAEALDDRLLECEEHCQVHGTLTEPDSCKNQCQTQVGFTQSKVRRREAQCKKDCARFPGLIRFLAFLGTAALLTVTPLLGAYKGACRCECCLGQGCSVRLALLNVAWVAYAFGCFWVLPSVLEDAGEVGGKVLFGITQGVAMAAMAASRSYADRANGARMPGSLPPPGSHQQLGVMVGAPVSGPSNLELQQQVRELQQQVRDLVRLQALQGNSAAARSAAPPSSASPAPAPKELL